MKNVVTLGAITLKSGDNEVHIAESTLSMELNGPEEMVCFLMNRDRMLAAIAPIKDGLMRGLEEMAQAEGWAKDQS